MIYRWMIEKQIAGKQMICEQIVEGSRTGPGS
jgi:hypothetical protein